ncbi:MAG: hypothetical protein AABW73_04555 [Nanoarchaeota archaeon]
MNIDDKLIDLSLIGAFGAATHAGIIADRFLFRKGLAKDYPKLDRILLQAEHVAHHATQTALAGAVFNTIDYIPSVNNVAAPIVSMIAGYGIDGKKKQWDQMASNIFGCVLGYYFLRNYYF